MRRKKGGHSTNSFGTISAGKPVGQSANARRKTVASQTASIIFKGAEDEHMEYTRRSVLAGLGMAALEAAMPPLATKSEVFSEMAPLATEIDTGTCPFRLAVINDEITQDFEKACQIVSRDFSLHWIELRAMWNKNVTEIGRAHVWNSSHPSISYAVFCLKKKKRKLQTLTREKKQKNINHSIKKIKQQ